MLVATLGDEMADTIDTGIPTRDLARATTNRFDYLTALRGWAASGVVLVHMYALPTPRPALSPILVPLVWGGLLVVPLFYVLSAFTLSLSASRRGGEPIVDFYIRRFFRIAPLFYVMIGVYLYTFGEKPVSVVLANLLFVNNFILPDDAYESIVAAGWSISVEMLFYAVFPVFFLVARDLKSALLLAVGALVVSFGVRLSLTSPGVVAVLVAGGLPPASVEKFSVITIFTNLPYFALGLVLFQLHQVLTAAKADLHDVGASFVFFAVSGLLCVAVVYAPENRPAADFASFVPLRHMAGFLFVLLVLGLAVCRVRLVVNRVTVFIGEISYSVYLLHVLVIWHLTPHYSAIYQMMRPTLAFVACATLTLSMASAVAYLAYILIERPGIALGARIISARRAALMAKVVQPE
jgi:peptidoglycan/LPS O-acetylase OafA/YrhL